MNRRLLIVSASQLAATLLPATAAAGIRSTASSNGEQFPIDYGDVLKLKPRFRRTEVKYATAEVPGSIVVDPGAKYLYFILNGWTAIRYGIGVGREGFEWNGEATVRRKAKWPRWTPPKEMVARDPLAAKWADSMPGGPDNPLGARALYLYQGSVDTLYRIHGTNQPDSIGKAVSSGCVRLINADIADLYERVKIGAKVVVLPAPPPETPSAESVQEKPQNQEKLQKKRRYLFDFL